jgi:hypothetical protein
MTENFVQALPHKYELIKNIYRKAIFQMLEISQA